METILEQQRSHHEARERLIDSMVKEMLHKKNGHKETINSDHRLKMMLDQYTESTNRLKELYEDKDGCRKEEIASLSGPNEFSEFYARLKSIKEFHRKHPNEICVPMSVEFDELNRMRENPTEEASNMVEFSDEEGYGKYLDLHECYEKYINLKGVEKVDYISYLAQFDRLFDIPKERKNAEYRTYLTILLDYLKGYVTRVKPLLDVEKDCKAVLKDFSAQFDAGAFQGWPKEAGSVLTHVGAHLDLSVHIVHGPLGKTFSSEGSSVAGSSINSDDEISCDSLNSSELEEITDSKKHEDDSNIDFKTSFKEKQKLFSQKIVTINENNLLVKSNNNFDSNIDFKASFKEKQKLFSQKIVTINENNLLVKSNNNFDAQKTSNVTFVNKENTSAPNEFESVAITESAISESVPRVSNETSSDSEMVNINNNENCVSENSVSDGVE
ncbi:splicing factor 3A subunit 3-like, partial [Diaphorina citri]|uniref:Splicing factor 3A subunit 3-like n=1 Tax=Diaphorina citri TaxID=121845 RepID=A0A3Q0JGI8_DIACI